GVAPQLRAALHAGPVITGEIGDIKRDIVFHGDVMNTAARIEQATRDLRRAFLVSAEALDRLAGTERYAFEPLGSHALRGRAAPVEIYAVAGGGGGGGGRWRCSRRREPSPPSVLLAVSGRLSRSDNSARIAHTPKVADSSPAGDLNLGLTSLGAITVGN